MPMYEYKCANCGKRFELIQKFSDAPLTVHEECGGGPVERLISAPALQFKGSGWYVNDYAKSGASKPDGASGKSESGSGKSESGKSEGGKSEGGKSEGGKSESGAAKTESSSSTPAASTPAVSNTSSHSGSSKSDK